MELQRISQVSKQFKISTRTLRYYEQIGLIQSTFKEDYSYRTYDEDTIFQLKQIIVLRKLRIPLKSIADILKTEDTTLTIEIFQQNLSEIGDEITALETIKSVIQSFIKCLNLKNAKLQLLDNESLLEIVDSLTTSKINFKEDKTMDDLIKANEKLNKITDRDVRIIYIPPMTVASIHKIGSIAELETGDLLYQFIKDKNLSEVKPDIRHFGFNNPNGQLSDMSDHGYERWISIPENMTVEQPFTKKKISGGLFAAYMIPMGMFEEWGEFWNWVEKNKKYEPDNRSGHPEMIGSLLEEHLNVISQYTNSPDEKSLQLDLLIAIKERN